ncbi:MAG: 16S rRNA (adenine(1518)-N(6)/adenine(1519)-N(6))-dimethyltransferase RsmA [Candidatus Omnitrophica bacterium]|nr:16S rRNA (adenine(1518)-N(6)/adenine(1519)-N(6))-dimethyltransferase RsmA [Candidatus Omnitrophota bacterium]MBU4140521.1 16S rRNA (adenine(1518)-N(6)/adenine(1519)-N(6))-dimethyltransferase RsmA [Candidatus Omnitrophota bacterium]
MLLRVSEIKDILKRERLSISKRRGQNFLVEPWIQRKIIDAVDIKADEDILEIGPGLGALTEDLARQSMRVIAIEKDRALARILQEMLSGYKNLQIIHQDILKTDIGKVCRKKVKAVGNLPYYITTPIIGYLLEEQRENIKEIFITVQDEVGRRLLAGAGNKDYSAITLLVQYFTKPELLFSIPKKAFYPQPRVNSVFIHLRILEKPPVKVNNPEQFFRIVRACFNQRRKIILNSLTHKLGKPEKERIQQILKKAGIDFQVRAERLSLREFAAIENVFYEKGIRL